MLSKTRWSQNASLQVVYLYRIAFRTNKTRPETLYGQNVTLLYYDVYGLHPSELLIGKSSAMRHCGFYLAHLHIRARSSYPLVPRWRDTNPECQRKVG